MRKLAIALLVMPLLVFGQKNSIAFTEEERAWIAEHPVVYHGFDPAWKPIGFANDKGDFVGISADIIKLVAEKTGIDFRPYKGVKDWTHSLELLQSGEIFFLPALAQNEERNKFLDFTESYLAYPFVIVTRKEGDFIGSLEGLDHRKVAAPSNYYITGLLEQEQVKMDFVYKNGVNECLWAVATEEAEATVANLAVVSHYLNYDGFENLKISAPAPYPKIEVKIGVAKGNEPLLNILQKGINALSAPEKNQIVQNWVSVQYEHGVDMAKVWTIAGVSGAVVILIFGSFIYWNRKLKSEVDLRQKAESQLRYSFLEITEQKKIIEHKNEEVFDSIRYAKRLQEAILPETSHVDERFEKNFVLYLPKDIVAGDFYWMETLPNMPNGNPVSLIAAADCTGHGVPGAMVSVVCSNALNQSVLQHKINDPGAILDKTTELVVQRFERSQQEVKDGMDIGLARVEYTPNGANIAFSGANNNLWVVSNREEITGAASVIQEGNLYLHEFKASKQPVGKYEGMQPFETVEVILLHSERFYLYSDGYADQFGGPKNKKFKAKKFKQLILDTYGMQISDQKDMLYKSFIEWKGDTEQLDDVCVIGVEV